MLSSLRLLSHTLFRTKFTCERGFIVCSCHLYMSNHRSHSVVIIFFYTIQFCVRNHNIFKAPSVGFSSFGTQQNIAGFSSFGTQQNIAGTLCTRTFCSLHVFFLYVQSIFSVTTFQCSFYEVKCAIVPYQRSPVKNDCNGSCRKDFMMCIDFWVWTHLSNLVRFC